MCASVLGAGLVAVDHIFLSSGSKRNGFKYLGSAGGGSVSNTLCMLSLLGHKTYICGVVGSDLAEHIVRSDFAQFGVDTSGLIPRRNTRHMKLTRQYSHVIHPDGRHSFRTRCLKCGKTFVRNIQMTDSSLPQNMELLAGRVDLLHLDRGNDATVHLASTARKSGKIVSFDFGFQSYGRYQDRTETILHKSTLVKVEEEVFRKYVGSVDHDGLKSWSSRHPDNEFLLVTRGSEGVLGFGKIGSERKYFTLPAIPSHHATDTAGAGDIFTAMAISGLLLRRGPQTEEELKHRLGLAQALASLSCGLYGARALQRTFLNQGISATAILETAESILQQGESGNSFSPRIGLPIPLSSPYRFVSSSDCSICGAPYRTPSRANRRTRTTYHDALERAPWAMGRAFEKGLALRSELKKYARIPGLFIGSGGSLSAAVFGEQLLLRSAGLAAKALPPFEFQNLETLPSDSCVWLLSYGGSNPDVVGAATRAVMLRVKNCIVITGTRNSKLSTIAEDHGWKVAYLEAQERGFVATIGMLAMMSCLAGILADDSELDKLKQFHDMNNLIRVFQAGALLGKQEVSRFTDMSTAFHLVALASGWGWPALTDLESKVVEGGVATIEVSELKNFTHGRYINAFHHRQNRKIVLIQSPAEAEFISFLHRKLKRYFQVSILRTDKNGVAGALELMVSSLFFASYLGQKVGRDISSPKYPPEARGLYGWTPSWLEAEERRSHENSSVSPNH